MSSEIAGVRKVFDIDLATARNGKPYTVKGRFIKVADSSDATAEIDIAVQDNIPSSYLTLKKNGAIIERNGFDRFFITNAAQAGKTVKIIVSEGPEDFDVINSDLSVDSIGSIDDPVEIIDDDLIAAIQDVEQSVDEAKADIVAMLQNDQSQRPGLTTLAGASYASQVSAGTNNVVTAGANLNGVIIRHFHWEGQVNGGYAQLRAGGNVIAGGAGLTTASGVGTGTIRDLFIPAGVAVDIVVATGDAGGYLWYEVL